MNTDSPEPKQLRRYVYGLMILIAFAINCGRIASVQRVYEPAFHRDVQKQGDRRPLWPSARPNPMPTFGSNDRSRWATIFALVHNGSYVVGKREPETIVVSGVTLFGATDPLEIAVLAQSGYYVRTTGPITPAQKHERDQAKAEGKRVPMTSQHGIIFKDGWQTIDAVLDPGTLDYYSSKPPLLSTLIAGLYWILYHLFGWNLDDHTAAVIRTILLIVNALPFAIYLWLLARIAETWGRTDWGKFYVVAAGAFGTMVSPFLITLNNHTVAVFAVMFALWSTLRIWRCVTENRTPSWYHFASAGLFSGFAITNELPALAFATAIFLLLLWWQPKQTLLLFVPAALLVTVAYFGSNYLAVGSWRPVQTDFKGPWYQFEGSHWKILPKEDAKKGIDFAKNVESQATYLMHVLVGHHGLFSLAPIWLLAVIGMLIASCRVGVMWRQAVFRTPGEFPWFIQPLGLALTVVVTGFYVMGDESRNYGGFTNGLRWLMWLIPIWLMCLLPVADWLAKSRVGRWFGGVCLAMSIFSVSYQLWSPWRHPWIFDLMIELGWPGY
ncbi:MAG TPA: hypothetical protein VFE62_06945 [Gemmataceae bacterium]|nr:hypothetical protein [Gemmataceae bacterium]